jgi:hypothetical protein
MKPLHVINALLLLVLSFISACSVQTKNILEINTNGFLNDNCYQAILVFDPDDNVNGLVAKRESAYLKAKKADLINLTLEKLTFTCLANKLQARVADKYKRDMLLDTLKNNAMIQVKGFVEGGSIAFVYYNEKNSIIIGYQLSKPGLKGRVDMLINSLEMESGYHNERQE